MATGQVRAEYGNTISVPTPHPRPRPHPRLIPDKKFSGNPYPHPRHRGTISQTATIPLFFLQILIDVHLHILSLRLACKSSTKISPITQANKHSSVLTLISYFPQYPNNKPLKKKKKKNHRKTI